jgi:RsiW-degrading membrane proteinase PrsW (M82 family)
MNTMKRANVMDAFAGFVAGLVFFLVVPLFVFHGNWGLLGYDTVQSLFPPIAANPQAVLMVLCLIYVVIDCLFFMIYRELPFYKKRHPHGVEPFLFALGAFLIGALVGYFVVTIFGLIIMGANGGPAL